MGNKPTRETKKNTMQKGEFVTRVYGFEMDLKSGVVSLSTILALSLLKYFTDISNWNFNFNCNCNSKSRS